MAGHDIRPNDVITFEYNPGMSKISETTMTIRLPVALRDAIERRAERQGISTSKVVRGFCEEGLRLKGPVTPDGRAVLKEIKKLRADLDALTKGS